MDDKQIAKFKEMVATLGHDFTGQLKQLKARGAEAVKDAAARHKALAPAVAQKNPLWKNLATHAAKLTKTIPAAEKAVQDILKLNDQKKLPAMKVDDLKKKIQKSMPALAAVSDQGLPFWDYVIKEQKNGGFSCESASATANYYHYYIDYFGKLKAELNSLR